MTQQAVLDMQAVRQDEEARDVVRIVVRRLLPLMIVIYTLGYLDRTNIGMAALKMRADLGMSQADFGLAAGVYSVGYLFFGVLSNLAMQRLGARRWLTFLMVVWGGATMLTSAVQSTPQLVIMRVLLGCAESGLYPGLIYYMSLWFPASWRARIVVVMGFPFAMILGAPLSAGIMQYLDGWLGLGGWRLMFLLEGGITVLFGLATLRLLTSRPEEARWLTPEQKEVLLSRLDPKPANEGKSNLREVLSSYQVWIFSLSYLCILAAFIILLTFVPQVISSFGDLLGRKFTLIEVSLVTAIPFTAAGGLAWLWVRHSDRKDERAWHGAIAALIGSVGLFISASAANVIILTIGLTIGAFGVWSSLSPLWSLLISSVKKRNIPMAVAVMNTIGATSSIVAPYVVGAVTDATGSFHFGIMMIGAAMILGAVLMVLGSNSLIRRKK